MKKSVSILIIICSLLFTQCEKQLELKPLGQLDENTYYQSESDFKAASFSSYSSILNLYYDQFGQGWYQAVLYPDDDVTTRNNEDNAQEDFNWNSNNFQFEYLWQQLYKGIQRANVIIEKLPAAKGFTDPSMKLRFEAEARFLRAYFHFLLATNFGNAPISDKFIANIDESRKANSEPGKIWDFVISDLEFAKQNLPAKWDDANIGRASGNAATALLGKVYLYRAQWDKNNSLYAKAITELESLRGKYTLVDFKNNFSPNTENNAESIFEIQFTRGDFNPWVPVDGDDGAAGSARLIFWRPACGPNNDCAPGSNGDGYGFMHVTAPMQNAFEANDPRKSASLFLEGDPFLSTTFKAAWSVTGSTPGKYIKQEDLTPRFPPNITTNNDRIIRYADVLLMLAEAKLLGSNDVAGAAALINEVRERADPTKTILPPRSAAETAAKMLEHLMRERRVELAFEGHRYADLVRWHRAGLINIDTDIDFGRTNANNAWNPRHLLKPIPQRELDLNTNLKQNDGYGN